jgi:hypothetical protein
MKSNSYTKIVWDTKGAGSTDVEGVNAKGDKQLFQVKTAVLPQTPRYLTEKTAIKARAKSKGASAWQPRVQLNSSYRLSGKIEFTQL